MVSRSSGLLGLWAGAVPGASQINVTATSLALALSAAQVPALLTASLLAVVRLGPGTCSRVS